MSNKMTVVFAQRKKVLLAVFLLTVVAILPIFEVKVVPEWQIQFVDENGEAVQNQRVQQTWTDYSKQWFSSMSGWDDTKMTDQNGFIVLPERYIRVSLLEFLLGWLWDVTPSINPHSSSGKHSHVLCRDKTICSISYREGESLPNRVIVKK